jgi:HAMP domain-containing protein
MTDSATIRTRIVERSGWREISGPLFRKYVALFLAVVCVALLSNGVFEIWFSYQEHKVSLIQFQHEKAVGAADQIGRFIREIESQVGWTTQLPWSAGTIEQRRTDGQRLLRQVPAITELAQLDSSGKEQLKVSRLAMDVVGSQADLSQDPKFTEAVAHKVYHGPVYFRRESEPYMTLALAGTRRDAGVSVAEVNLKLIWDVILQIKVGEKGLAYAVDAQGRLIAHPDISLVLRNTDMTRLAQVSAARAAGNDPSVEPVQEALDVKGKNVLTAYAPVTSLGWLVFVELPVDEAYGPLYTSIERSGALLFGGLVLAFLAGLFLARRMVGPIQALRAGAARIGRGDLGQRISIKTGDELEGLADQFNDMAGILCRPGAEGRGPHPRARAIGRRAARARRGQPDGQFDARRGDRAQHDRHQGGATVGHRCRRHLRVRPGHQAVPPALDLRHVRGDDRGHQGAPGRRRRRARAGGQATRAGADRRPARPADLARS